MNILHHVKKHWKTITLHLKKHHKKYIFWILSATLLWKWIGLIATYAVIHNISFSFADVITWWDEEPVIETEITNEEESVTNENEITNTDEESNQNDSTTENDEETETDIEDDTIIQENIDEYVVTGDNSTENETNSNEAPNENNQTNNSEEENIWNIENEDNENNDNENTETIEENNTTNNESWNWLCDYWDMRIISPKEWDIVWKIFDISREYTNNDCKNDSYIIKLRDQNNQYLDVFLWNINHTWFSFDSTQLMSGFYNITGTNESWDTIILHEWKYAWNATNYFSGHKIAIVSNDWETVYRNDDGWEFTIDNKAPEISNIRVVYSTKNRKLNIGDTITISFDSDEELQKTTVNILGQNALLEEKNWNKYKYTMDFSERNTLGKVVYWIEFEDKIWNTWYVEWYENTELDYTKPRITDLWFSLLWEWKIRMTFDTNKKTDANLVYKEQGTNKIKSINSEWTNQHRITIENIQETDRYDYSISIQDEAKNEMYIWWKFYISWNEIIFTEKVIGKAELLTETWFTWDDKKQNIFNNNFNDCIKDINTKELKLVINNQKNTIVNVPEFTTSSTKKLTNAFIAVLFERIEKKHLPQYAIDEITEDLNNFLLIVKLVRDDNNECKQNKTQYYINRFKNTLENYWLINH